MKIYIVCIGWAYVLYVGDLREAHRVTGEYSTFDAALAHAKRAYPEYEIINHTQVDM